MANEPVPLVVVVVEEPLLKIETFAGLPLRLWFHASYIGSVVSVTSCIFLIAFKMYPPSLLFVFLFFLTTAGWIDCLYSNETTRDVLARASLRYKNTFSIAAAVTLTVSLLSILSVATSPRRSNLEVATLSIMCIATALCLTLWNRIAAFRREWDLVR